MKKTACNLSHCHSTQGLRKTVNPPNTEKPKEMAFLLRQKSLYSNCFRNYYRMALLFPTGQPN